MKYNFDGLVVCEGTLMFHDTPIAEIYLDECDVTRLTLICQEKRLWPLELQYDPTSYGLLRFFEERVTPKTRYGIQEELAALGFSRYSMAAITITSNGRDCSDPYWVRFKDGPQTWKDVWAAIGVYNRV